MPRKSQAKRPSKEASNPFDAPDEKSDSNPFDDRTNPFEDGSDANGTNPFDDGTNGHGKMKQSSNGGDHCLESVDPFDTSSTIGGTTTGTGTEDESSTNPFEFDAEYPSAALAKGRQTLGMNLFRRRGADQEGTSPEEEAIINGMDQDETSRGSGSRPSSIASQTGRARTAGAGAATQLTSWLRGNKDNQNDGVTEFADGIPEIPEKVKRNGIAHWPYDDYHIVQETYYESLKLQREAAPEDEEQQVEMFQRPAELPAIPEAVKGLPLMEFEHKAQERAIGIVATWLYDTGLLDELLVNGAVQSSNTSVDEHSTRTSEGVEVNATGLPMDQGLKMEKEMEKLRAGTQRELSLVNARLNDGVAASGAEVQELVNAVAATQGDLGRLRELSTYITNGLPGSEQMDDPDEFLLTNFPRLKTAINARRNLFRIFRELDFFAQISTTCNRLRDELHAGEWTEDEWNSIRKVCMEHVELEILLVEAESGMKARMDDGGNGRSEYGGGFGANYDAVDKFLSEHAKNVWELGEEIRLRVLSGIGSSFDLAINNPAGMVALVEAVEVYERAARQYGKSRSESRKNKLRFTDMRAASLAQIYQDLELRGVEVFRGIQMQAADAAEESELAQAQFTAILRASTQMVAEIDLVKNQMAPCFPADWAIEVLWCSCVAHVCSQQILQQIGGPEAHNLPDLTVTQLLDLVAWVEYFRETIYDAFPRIKTMESSKKTYLDSRPDLFSGNHKKVDIDTAADGLAWANNMLYEVHRLAQEEFLMRTQGQTSTWVDSVYSAEHERHQHQDGRLTTSLCEDIFALASVQLRTIRERLSRKSDALVLAVTVIFSNLRSKQMMCRDSFLLDLESCCAASNDFVRMSEKTEELLQDLEDECELTEALASTLDVSSGELLAVYSSDAVYACQCVHMYVFEPIEEALGEDLFGKEWETELTSNELALTLVRTVEDFMGDLEIYLEELMVRKAVDALVNATILFYVKKLLMKAENHKSNKESCFQDNTVALKRISGDIKVMREYFESLVDRMPALGRVIEREFEILSNIHELMSIAAGISFGDASDFVLLFQKRIRDVELTKCVAGDLYHLVNPAEERTIWELVESLEEELNMIAPKDMDAAKTAQDHSAVPGLKIDAVLAELYEQSKRKRPVKAGAAEKIMGSWQKTWGNEEEQPPQEEQQLDE